MATFLKLHHGFLEHEKHAELSNAALLLHISGLMHASERLTDGRLSKAPAVRIAWSSRLIAEGHDTDTLIAELIDAGVWTDDGDRYQIVNYSDHNNTRAVVEQIRAADRERKRKARERKAEIAEIKGKTPLDTEVETETGNPTTFQPDSVRCPTGRQADKLRAVRSITP